MASLEEDVARARAAGRTLGPFVLLDELGRGGMGVVWRAWDERRRAAVALKLLAPALGADAEAVARLRREAEAGAALDHPAVVRPLDAGHAQGRAYVALELVAGASLEARLPPRGDLDLRGAVRALRDVARGLAHAHARGVVHRDVKPSNVLVDPGGAGHLIDLGLARLVHDAARRLTATGTVLGTPAYMAPEQALGDGARAGPPADAWGLGAALYRTLAGTAPFERGSPMATLRAVLEEAPAPPSRLAPGVDRDLEALALTCLARDPARRPTAAAIADALDAWLRPRRRRAGRRRPALALAAATVTGLLAAVALAGVLASRATPRGPPAPAPPAPPAPPAHPAPAPPAPAPPAPAPPADVDALVERAMEAAALGQLEQARATCDEALRAAPEDPELLSVRALIRFRAHDHAGAAADVEAALARTPDAPNALLTRGGLRSATGDHAGAVADLDRALVATPPDGAATVLMARSNARRRSGALRHALADADEALVRAPHAADALRARILALVELERWREAPAALEQLTAVDPGPETLAVAARVLAGPGGDVDAAADAAEAAGAVLSPDHLRLAWARAEVARARGDLERAAAELERIAARDPHDVTPWLHLAATRLAQGAHEAAEAAARRATVASPGGAWAWLQLGVVLGVGGDAAGAVAALDRALALEPELLRALGVRAHARLATGDVRGAIADAEALAHLDDDPAARLTLAWVRLAADDVPGAAAALGRAGPAGDTPLAHALAAQLALARGDPRAEALADAVQAALPGEPLTLAVLAEARGRRGDAEGALAAARASLARQSTPEGHCALAGALLAAGRFPEAAEAAAQAIAQRPAWSWPRRARAAAALNLHDLPTAAADLDVALAADPGSVQSLGLRGRLRQLRGDVAGALDDATQALAHAPEDGQARVLRASLLVHADRAREALADLEIAAAALERGGPRHVRASLALVRAHARLSLGDHAGALADAEAVLALRPDDAPATTVRAAALLGLGRAREAAAAARRGADLAPATPEAWLTLGRAHAALGEVAAARAALERCRTLDAAGELRTEVERALGALGDPAPAGDR